MITKPKIEPRSAQHYVGIRTLALPKQFKSIVPEFIDEIISWLAAQGIDRNGPPFLRYYVIDMNGSMDVEVGVPVATTLPGTDRISPGILPAGHYASLIFSGVTGYKGNKALIEWAVKQGIKWDRWDDKHGDAFRSRVEFSLTDPTDERDRKKWETEVMIKLLDEQPSS